MRILSKRALEVYLAREVLGKPIQRATFSAQPKPRAPIAKKRKEPRRERPVRMPEAHGRWIRSLACAACGATRYLEAAHVGLDGGMRQKASDDLRIPLCIECHRLGAHAYHRIGRKSFEAYWDLDCLALACQLREDWKKLRARAETKNLEKSA